MPRYKITQHLTGWKVVENFIAAKDEDEAGTEALIQVKMNLHDYIDADVEEVNEKV